MSQLEDNFLRYMQALNIPEPEKEYRFDLKRQWKFDFAWPDQMLAVEIEGGTWSGGRHTSGIGYRNDCEKYNSATLLGWQVLRFTADMIASGEALNLIEKLFQEEVKKK